MVALVVTLACLPLLALDLIGGRSAASGDASETAQVSTEAPDPSLVVALDPTTTEAPTTTSTTAAPTTTVPPTTAPPTTVAPTTTVPPTTAPPTTVAPAPVYVPPPTTVAPPPPPPAPTMGGDVAAFFACVRQRESGGNYGAVDPSGTYRGAYQIYQGGWDAYAAKIGRPDLIGVPPNLASPADQDAVALAMYNELGKAPWQAHGQTYNC